MALWHTKLFQPPILVGLLWLPTKSLPQIFTVLVMSVMDTTSFLRRHTVVAIYLSCLMILIAPHFPESGNIFSSLDFRNNSRVVLLEAT